MAIQGQEEIAKTLVERIIAGDASSMPALLLGVSLLSIGAVVWLARHIINSKIAEADELQKRIDKQLEDKDAIQEKYTDKLEQMVTKYHEDRQRAQESHNRDLAAINSTLTNLRDTMAQLLGALSVMRDVRPPSGNPRNED